MNVAGKIGGGLIAGYVAGGCGGYAQPVTYGFGAVQFQFIGGAGGNAGMLVGAGGAGRDRPIPKRPQPCGPQQLSAAAVAVAANVQKPMTTEISAERMALSLTEAKSIIGAAAPATPRRMPDTAAFPERCRERGFANLPRLPRVAFAAPGH